MVAYCLLSLLPGVVEGRRSHIDQLGVVTSVECQDQSKMGLRQHCPNGPYVRIMAISGTGGPATETEIKIELVPRTFQDQESHVEMLY